MSSAHEYHWIPLEVKVQPRQLGWASLFVEAIDAARLSAIDVSEDRVRSGARCRLARALLTQPRISDCMVVAVLACAGDGRVAEMTPVARTAPRAATMTSRRRVGRGARSR